VAERGSPLRGSRPPARYAPVAPTSHPPLQEVVIASEPGSRAVAAWVEALQPEDAPLLAARARAAEVGVAAVDPSTGAVLRLLAATTRAKAVVELGTGVGVSALWLLRGMREDGVLTSVDSEAEHQRLARQSITEAGVPASRARLISGRALEVMPRLSDAAYDLVFCDAARSEYLEYLEGAVRLLRPGGCVVFAGALAGGKVADSAARDNDTVALRELARAVRDDTRLVPAVLPVGPGLLVATVLSDQPG
jgi:predicted O-methyltransferase YrrM